MHASLFQALIQTLLPHADRTQQTSPLLVQVWTSLALAAYGNRVTVSIQPLTCDSIEVKDMQEYIKLCSSALGRFVRIVRGSETGCALAAVAVCACMTVCKSVYVIVTSIDLTASGWKLSEESTRVAAATAVLGVVLVNVCAC
jgi:hypothetical protein